MFHKKLSKDYGLKQLVSQPEPQEPNQFAEIHKFFDALSRYYGVPRAKVAVDVHIAPRVHAQVKIKDQEARSPQGEQPESAGPMGEFQTQQSQGPQGEQSASAAPMGESQIQQSQNSQGEQHPASPMGKSQIQQTASRQEEQPAFAAPMGKSQIQQTACPQGPQWQSVKVLELPDLLSILGMPVQLPGIKWIAKRRLLSFFEQKPGELNGGIGQLTVRILDQQGELGVHLFLDGEFCQKMDFGEVRRKLMG